MLSESNDERSLEGCHGGQVSGYRLERQLGVGSFAIVFKGVSVNAKPIDENDMDEKKPVTVAIKAIRKIANIGNLENEIAILKNHRHENIVKMYGMQKSEFFVYVLLEYCAGGDLHQLIKTRKNGRLSEKMTRCVMKDLTSGLMYLRKENIIHRDIKPQNLLLAGHIPINDSDDETSTGSEVLTVESNKFSLKIADFGFAKIAEYNDSPSHMTLCGSPLYMAPEVLKHESYDSKVDLWSTGVVLFEMVTGRTPFMGINTMELIRDINEKNNETIFESIQCAPLCKSLMRILIVTEPKMRSSFAEFEAASCAFVTSALSFSGNTLERVPLLSTIKPTPIVPQSKSSCLSKLSDYRHCKSYESSNDTQDSLPSEFGSLVIIQPSTHEQNLDDHDSSVKLKLSQQYKSQHFDNSAVNPIQNNRLKSGSCAHIVLEEHEGEHVQGNANEDSHGFNTKKSNMTLNRQLFKEGASLEHVQSTIKQRGNDCPMPLVSNSLPVSNNKREQPDYDSKRKHHSLLLQTDFDKIDLTKNQHFSLVTSTERNTSFPEDIDSPSKLLDFFETNSVCENDSFSLNLDCGANEHNTSCTKSSKQDFSIENSSSLSNPDTKFKESRESEPVTQKDSFQVEVPQNMLDHSKEHPDKERSQNALPSRSAQNSSPRRNIKLRRFVLLKNVFLCLIPLILLLCSKFPFIQDLKTSQSMKSFIQCQVYDGIGLNRNTFHNSNTVEDKTGLNIMHQPVEYAFLSEQCAVGEQCDVEAKIGREHPKENISNLSQVPDSHINDSSEQELRASLSSDLGTPNNVGDVFFVFDDKMFWRRVLQGIKVVELLLGAVCIILFVHYFGERISTGFLHLKLFERSDENTTKTVNLQEKPFNMVLRATKKIEEDLCQHLHPKEGSVSCLRTYTTHPQTPTKSTDIFNLQSLTVSHLKDKLRQKGLHVSGRKSVLVERLQSNLQTMTVVQLKNELRNQGLMVSGKKTLLINRIIAASPDDKKRPTNTI
eukprot:CAMPEP_0194413896 /NCGR_PEP_ID=MMETSP0176-20130528/12426_1 /TAXON_ID=216777 /ORGANISM="Proboscia alata, Strain PI-D3" /LENGTH=995 /DNA_ID=CAMNT_0039217477 /DNA_START=59 /DNA_END=3046 /DNA_ORIENTATION=+